MHLHGPGKVPNCHISPPCIQVTAVTSQQLFLDALHVIPLRPRVFAGCHPGAVPFRVICCNIGLQDNQFVKSWDGARIKDRLADMSSLVKEIAVDVILFQELAPTHCCIIEFVLIL